MATLLVEEVPPPNPSICRPSGSGLPAEMHQRGYRFMSRDCSAYPLQGIKHKIVRQLTGIFSRHCLAHWLDTGCGLDLLDCNEQ